MTSDQRAVTADPAGTARRELGVAVALCLAGAAAVLAACAATWVSVRLAPTPLLPGRVVRVGGGDLAPGVSALGLLGLAGVAALAATKGRGRRVVGGVLALAGAAVAALVVVLLRDLAGAAAASGPVTSTGGAAAGASASAWPLLALAGGLLVAGAGLLAAVRGGRWAAMSRRYEAPGARTGQARDADRGGSGMWDDLDRGSDPTAGPT